MSCVVGIVSDGKVYMGSDSAGVNSAGELQLRRDPKVFINGQYLIGVSGNFRAMQAVRFAYLPEKTLVSESTDTFQWMVDFFLPAIRKLNLPDCEMLVGFRGRLFHLYGTEQVSEEIADYEACGSGAQVARGSLFTSERESDPPERIMLALESAERFCSGVRSPFRLLSL